MRQERYKSAGGPYLGSDIKEFGRSVASETGPQRRRTFGGYVPELRGHHTQSNHHLHPRHPVFPRGSVEIPAAIGFGVPETGVKASKKKERTPARVRSEVPVSPPPRKDSCAKCTIERRPPKPSRKRGI